MRRAPKGATFGEGEVMSQGALGSKAAMGRLRRVHLGLGQKAVSEGNGNGLEAAVRVHGNHRWRSAVAENKGRWNSLCESTGNTSNTSI